MSASDEVWVVGVGHTRFGDHRGTRLRQLSAEALGAALADAGAGVEDVEALFFANTSAGALGGQHMVPGQVATREAGIEGIPVFNVENACASGSSALHLASAYVRSGAADVVMALGADKLCRDDPAEVLEYFQGAMDVEETEPTLERLLALSSLRPPEGHDPGVRTVFMNIYASMARFHMERHGTTPEQMATIAAKNHLHSTHNANCHYQRPFTVEEVLAGRAVSWPFTVPMCSPVSDGAAAVLLSRGDVMDRFDRTRAVRVLGCAALSGSNREPSDERRHVSRRAAERAYTQAGIEPADVDVAEVHDATAFGEVQQTENLGLCGLGEGGALAQSGATRLGGRVPVNPSGGLESRGHPVAATGLAQVHELVTQLRGEAGPRQVPGASIAVAENGGGLVGIEEGAAVVTVLGR